MYLKLKNLRKKKKYTVADMGNILGISPSYYSQLENGKKKLSYKQATSIAKVFGKKPDQIFYEDDV
jgi:transcriptional regulator with XRE-family HTH domain